MARTLVAAMRGGARRHRGVAQPRAAAQDRRGVASRRSRSARARAVRASAARGARLGRRSAASWVAFGAQPWELLPFRDERVLAPMLRDVGTGVVDFYGVFLPFVPVRNSRDALARPVRGLRLHARRGAARRGATADRRRRSHGGGVGWPATLFGGSAVAFGALALAAGARDPARPARELAARARSREPRSRRSSSSARRRRRRRRRSARDAALDWETWDIRGPADAGERACASSGTRTTTGITFPPTKTVVLRVDGPTSAELLADDDARPRSRTTTGSRISSGSSRSTAMKRALQLAAARARERARSPRTGSSSASRSRRSSTTTSPRRARRSRSMRAGSEPSSSSRAASCGSASPCRGRQRYSVWSYAPDPAPRALAAAPVRLPPAAHPLPRGGRTRLPGFATPRREQGRAAFSARSVVPRLRLAAHDVRRRAAAWPARRRRRTEPSWRSSRGSGRQEGSATTSRLRARPARRSSTFVTRTKAGYCQHFAGAMALMLRMLGIPARVAVGFTSGSPRRRRHWVVTDHDAHAWVEVWFAGERLGSVRSDARARDARRRLLVRVRLAGGGRGAAARASSAGTTPERTPRVPDASDLPDDGRHRRPTAAPSLVGVGLVLAAVWILVVGLGKAVRRRLRYLSRDPRRLATASRRELEGLPARSGCRRSRANATLATLQRAVRQELGLDARRVRDRGRACALRAPGDAGAAEASRARQERAAAHPRSPARALRLGALPRVRVAPLAPHRGRLVSETYDLFQLGRSHLRSGMPAQATVLAGEGEARTSRRRVRSARRSASRTSGSAAGRRRRPSFARSSSSIPRTSSRTTRSAARSSTRGGARKRCRTSSSARSLRPRHRRRRRSSSRARGRPARPEASVAVGGEVVAEIGAGVVVLLGVAGARHARSRAERLAGKVARLRIFENEDGRFDRSLLDVGGEALVVSQFTLIADSKRQKGTRPDFYAGSAPRGRRAAVRALLRGAPRARRAASQTGVFGARMQVVARQRRAGDDRPRHRVVSRPHRERSF